MAANDSILSSISQSGGNNASLVRVLNNVVETQKTFATQSMSLHREIELLKDDLRRSMASLTTEFRRNEERTERLVADLSASHAAERESLLDLLKTALSRPVHQQSQPQPQQRQVVAMTPQQQYNNALPASALFGGPQQAPLGQDAINQLAEQFGTQASINQQQQLAMMQRFLMQQQAQQRATAQAQVPGFPPTSATIAQATAPAQSTAALASSLVTPATAPAVTSVATQPSISFINAGPKQTVQSVLTSSPLTKVEEKASVPVVAAPAVTHKPSLTMGTSGSAAAATTPLGTVASPASVTKPIFGGFAMPKLTTEVKPPVLTFGTSTFKPTEVKKEPAEEEDDEDDKVEEYEPDVHFAPVVPLPDKVDTVTGEEGEKVDFEEHCKMYRFVAKEWKERATGILKVLSSKSGKHRVVMRRDQVHKVAANFAINTTVKVVRMGNNEKAVTWFCHDFSESEDGQHEQLSVRFGSPAKADEFMRLVNDFAAEESVSEEKEESSDDDDDSRSGSSSPTQSTPTKEAPTPKTDVKPGMPKPGSWECPACYVRNDAGSTSCSCCGTKPDGSQGEKDPFAKAAAAPIATATTAEKPKFSFGFGGGTASPAPSALSLEKPAAKMSFGEAAAAAAAAAPSPSIPATTSTPKFGSAFGASLQGANTSSTTASPISFSFAAKPAAAAVSSSSTTASASPMPTFSFKNTAPATSIFGGGPKGTSLFGGSAASPSTISAGTPNLSSLSLASPSSASPSPASPSLSFATASSAADSAKPASSVFGSAFKSSVSFASVAGSKPSIFESAEKQEEAKKNFANLAKSKPFGAAAAEPAAVKREDEDDDDAPEEYEPDVQFAPVVPLPELVAVVTGEEGEEEKVRTRGKLFRLVRGESNEYKERGVGDIKILFNPSTGKYRVVMRREQVHKICANFPVLPETSINFKKDQPTVLTLIANDFAEEPAGRMEIFSIRFKTAEIAKDFYSKFVAAQDELRNASTA